MDKQQFINIDDSYADIQNLIKRIGLIISSDQESIFKEKDKSNELLNLIEDLKGILNLLEHFDFVFLLDEILIALKTAYDTQSSSISSLLACVELAMPLLDNNLTLNHKTSSENSVKIIVIINNLRALQKLPLFSAHVIDNQKLNDLTTLKKDWDIGPISSQLIQARKQYQLTFLNLVRDTDVDDSLSILLDIILKIKEVCDPYCKQPLWLLTLALIELNRQTIKSGVLSTPIKLILRQVDSCIKYMSSGELSYFSTFNFMMLIKNIIFYIESSSCQGNYINDAKVYYGLEHNKNYLSLLNDHEKQDCNITRLVHVFTHLSDLIQCLNDCDKKINIMDFWSVSDSLLCCGYMQDARCIQNAINKFSRSGDLNEVKIVNEILDKIKGDLEKNNDRDHTYDSEVDINEKDDDSDDIIIIFIEEVLEALSIILEKLEALRENHKDKVIQKEIQRSFHTLKGSGHIVGAVQIADLATSMDSLMKSVIIENLIVNESIIDLIEQSCQMLPELTRAMTDKTSSDIDVKAFIDKIDCIINGVKLKEDKTATETNVKVKTEAVAEVSEVDNELIEIYLEEAQEILDHSNDLIGQWRLDINKTDEIFELQRDLHTLKGGARMVGFTDIANLGHELENIYSALVENRLTPSLSLISLVEQGHDRLANMIDCVRNQESYSPADDLIKLFNNLLLSHKLNPLEDKSQLDEVIENKGEANSIDVEKTPIEPCELSNDNCSDINKLEKDISHDLNDKIKTDEIIDVADVPKSLPVIDEMEHSTENKKPLVNTIEPVVKLTPQSTTKKPETRRSSHELIRVHPFFIDKLANLVGESSIARLRLDQEVSAVSEVIEDLTQTMSRLREQLRQIEIGSEAEITFSKGEIESKGYEEFDPLEMDRYSQLQEVSRSMIETLSDLFSIKDNLSRFARESNLILNGQSAVHEDLQDALLSTRLVSFNNIMPRLQRIVRQVSSELGKKIGIEVSGSDVEIDRLIESRIGAPLEHMIRNSIDHGIESPEIRKQAGKPEEGKIKISFNRDDSNVFITFRDDGAGINKDKVYQKAIDNKLIDQGCKLSQHQIYQLILKPGFSTSDKITQISGRGVGLDVVDSEVRQLGGAIYIDSKLGEHTEFKVKLPATLSMNQVLMVCVEMETYAIPISNIIGVACMSQNELTKHYSQPIPIFNYSGEHYRLVDLSDLLGFEKSPAQVQHNDVYPILLFYGEVPIAVKVDSILRSSEVVIKSLSEPFKSLTGVAGASIASDGNVVIILDMLMLAHESFVSHKPIRVVNRIDENEVEEKKIIMIVDDSVTVRKVTSRLLDRSGYQSITAKDGLDAKELLELKTPDLILLDIEMPRMDGFEFATYVKETDILKDIPIVMITSRTGSKHRQRAEDIGVDSYLGKPFKENNLLTVIKRLIKSSNGNDFL